MNEKVYLVKKDPEKPCSEDNWIVMNKQEFALFLDTEEGKRRSSSFGRLDGCTFSDGAIIAECGAKLAKEWRAQKDRRIYSERVREKTGISFMSLDSAINEETDSCFSEIYAIEDMSTEDVFFERLELQELREAIKRLSSDDYDLVFNLFLADTTVNAKEYAKLNRIPYTTVVYRRDRVLKRLKDIIAA